CSCRKDISARLCDAAVWMIVAPPARRRSGLRLRHRYACNDQAALPAGGGEFAAADPEGGRILGARGPKAAISGAGPRMLWALPGRNHPVCGDVVVRSLAYKGEPMTQARYFVVQRDDVWMIKFDDEEYGPYKSKNEAMVFAIDAAQKLGEHGESADVVLMGENNHVRPEWVYGRDPYPPRLSGV